MRRLCPTKSADGINAAASLIPGGRAVYCDASQRCVSSVNCRVSLQAVPKARWQSGYAAACKAADIGSIPFLASIRLFTTLHCLSQHADFAQ